MTNTLPNRKKGNFLKNIIIISICVIIIMLGLYSMRGNILQVIYPQEYKEFVERYAKEYDVEEELVYAIIKAESNFNSNAKSHSEAYGLMQLLESTAVEMANEIGEENVKVEVLYNPETNVKIGTAYIAKLLERYNGNYVLALAAYNAGIGNVADWIEKGILKKDGTNPEKIPFKETNMYVRKIMRDYQIYKNIYP